MSSDTCRAGPRDRDVTRIAVDILYLLLIIAVPVILYGEAFNQEILKATVLVVLVMVLVAVRSYRAVVAGFYESGASPLTRATAAFAGALLLTSALSPQPWVAFTGAPGRGIGAVTYLAHLAILHGVFRDFRQRPVEPLLRALLAAHAVVVGYALFQAYGADPFDWTSQMSFAGYVSSTLANPNFASAFVALTLPFLVRHQFNPALRPALRVAGATAVAVSMAVIAFMDSFQGQVVSLVALVVPLVWVSQQSGRRRFEALFHVAPTAGAIVLLPVLLARSVPGRLNNGMPDPLHLTGPGSRIVAVTMLVLGAWTWLGIIRQDRWTQGVEEAGSSRGPRTYWLSVSVGATATVAVAAVLAWPLVAAQVATGLDHRREMWLVGLRTLRENPFFGTGLETYYSYFSPLRPVEHAVRFEGILSNNIHSVPLSMFSGGGLLLGCTYLALLGVIGAYGVLALRRSSGPEQMIIGTVLAAWLAYHLQSSVSVDVAGLAYTQWVLAGILVARGAPEALRIVPFPWIRSRSVSAASRPRHRSPAGQRRSTPFQRRLAFLAAVATVLALLGPVTAPMRADFAYRDAEEARLAGSIQEAHDHIQRAIRLDSRNGQYAERLGRIYVRVGDLQSALGELERSARLRPGFASAERLAARINIDNGDIGRAIFWYERALSSEPYGPYGLNVAARFYVTAGESNRMYERLLGYEALNLQILGPVIAGVYEVLGDEENAMRIRDAA